MDIYKTLSKIDASLADRHNKMHFFFGIRIR